MALNMTEAASRGHAALRPDLPALPLRLLLPLRAQLRKEKEKIYIFLEKNIFFQKGKIFKSRACKEVHCCTAQHGNGCALLAPTRSPLHKSALEVLFGSCFPNAGQGSRGCFW